MKSILWLTWLLSPALMAQTTFYQCEVGGVVTFSQFPCDKTEQGQKEQSVQTGPISATELRAMQRETLAKRHRFFDYQLQKLDVDYQREMDRLNILLRQQMKLEAGQEQAQQTQLQIQDLQTSYQRSLVQIEAQRAEVELQLEQLDQIKSK
jgi:hypothetical protein